MKIVHISDIHIRNLKYHAEYRAVFDNFFKDIDELKPDVVVNTGDSAHTKTNISPEFVEMASYLFMEISKRCPLIVVLGNHDLNLMNEDRQDAITPIVDALGDDRIKLLKKSGEYEFDFLPGVTFWNYGISDAMNWPVGKKVDGNVNIGLFHGAMKNSITDSNFRMTNVEYDIGIFDNMDFVMMGDIHKRQSFCNQRFWYAGSMIQQNFGEDTEKGYLVWNIKNRDEFFVDFKELKGNRRFYTVKLDDDLVLPDCRIDQNSRVRIVPPRSLTLVEQKAIEKEAKKKYSTNDVITLGTTNSSSQYANVAGKAIAIENMRQPDVQERLIREFLQSRNLSERVLKKIIDVNKKYQVSVEQNDEIARNINWKIKKIGWSNLYNYGEGNVIDFSNIKGLTGIFAPNASGKSGMIDAITIGLFDSNTKEVAKNVNLINDNKDKAVIIMDLLSDNEQYTVERVIERIKIGKNKGNEKEWGKTSLNFYRSENADTAEKLVGETRPETERNIRRHFGSFDDFMLTSLFAQWDPMDIIMRKETDRKRILYRFLDLDIFEEKAKLAKEEARQWANKLAELEDSGYESAITQLEEKIAANKEKIENEESEICRLSSSICDIETIIERLLESKIPIGTVVNVENEQLKIVSLEAEVAELHKQLIARKTHNELLLRKKEELYRSIVNFDVAYHQSKSLRLKDVEDKISNIRALSAEFSRNVATCKKQIAILDDTPCGSKFSSCKFLVNAFAAKNEMAEYEMKISKLNEKMMTLIEEAKLLADSSKALDDYENVIDSIEEIDHGIKVSLLDMKNRELQIENIESDIARLKIEIERCEKIKQDIQKNKELDAEIKTYRIDKLKIETDVKTRRDTMSKLNRQLGLDQGMLDRAMHEIEQLKDVRDMCSAFEHFSAAMGKDGIALQILTQKLPLINEEINKILGASAEFNVFIEYDANEQSIRLYIQYGHYKSRLLELGSGAEKFIASLAIRSALLSISNLPKSNMFIIDEGFGKLDPQNLESVQRMFDYLKSVFDHVVVISHTDSMKDMVDNIIDIVPDEEGYAHVDIGG